jgi:hypothetical protein
MAEVDGRAADPDATQLSVASTEPEPNRWAVLALLSVAQLMVVLDATIVTIAIPSAQEALHSPRRAGSGSSPPMRSPSAASCCWVGSSVIFSDASGP